MESCGDGTNGLISALLNIQNEFYGVLKALTLFFHHSEIWLFRHQAPEAELGLLSFLRQHVEIVAVGDSDVKDSVSSCVFLFTALSNSYFAGNI